MRLLPHVLRAKPASYVLSVRQQAWFSRSAGRRLPDVHIANQAVERSQTLDGDSNLHIPEQHDPSTSMHGKTTPFQHQGVAFAALPLSSFSTDLIPWIQCVLIPSAYSLGTFGIFLNPLLEVMPRIRREGTVGKLPLLPYSMMFVSNATWTTWGLLSGLPAVWLPNSAGLILSLYYTISFCKWCPKDADWLPFRRHAHWTGMLVVAGLVANIALFLPEDTARHLLGLMGNAFYVAMMASPLAALRTVIATQSTQCLPFGFTCVCFFTNMVGSYYSFCVINDVMLFIPNSLGAMVGLAQLMLFARFGIYRG